ncbi:HCP-like protein [Mycena alexandri]|uniref:HCP-like protein n=1 Tax=Mycena alexandri TaxID=1745969 RepID=A0AAD6SHZ0_9AGAR|nr:HCP-like protein [Mycena alexandri]
MSQTRFVPPQLAFQESPPHFADPLVAPRPHRVDPQIGVNVSCFYVYGGVDVVHDRRRRAAAALGLMARDLDARMHTLSLTPAPYLGGQPNPYNPNPAARTPSPLPPPNAEWSPWAGAANPAANAARTPSPMPPRLPSPARDGTLTAPLPTQAALTAALPSIAAAPPDAQLAWARDVLFLVDRTPALAASPLALAAVPLILAQAQAAVPEAVYYRATFAAAGTYPALLPPNPRAAFRDFEAAARAGWAPAWFRLARDYEAFSDTAHALDCLNRGAKARDAAALHRLGTAYLLKQLGVQEDVPRALGLLHQAACRASLLCPQPAYVFGLILLGEFGASGPTSTPLPIPPALLLPLIPPGQTRELYARAMLERAAALHFAPAQYKLGHAFEFAVPASAFPFDPLLSVQWYSLASQAGEAEADMALSKWFLCGAEGAFDKDESLARTFAAKAAAKGLPSGEFAMGYYCEVGIGGGGGGGKELGEARGWYAKAAAHGNTDAAERLRALALAVPQALSRTEHDALTGDKLVRKRTQARLRSDREGGSAFSAEPETFANPHPEIPNPYAAGAAPGPGGRQQQQQQQGQGPPSAYRGAYGQPQAQQDPAQRRTRVMELARKSSLADGSHYRQASAGGFDYRAGGGGPPPPGAGYGAPQGGGNPYAQNGNGYAPPGPPGGQNGNGGYGGAGGAGAGAGRGRMPPPREASMGQGPGPGQGQGQGPGRMPPPRDGSLPPGAGRQGTGPGTGPRYALSDTGSRPGSVAGSVASGGGGGGGGAGGRAQGTPPLRRPGAGGRENSAAATPAPAPAGNLGPHGGTGPATFAEMGFTGAKAEDKECVVM